MAEMTAIRMTRRSRYFISECLIDEKMVFNSYGNTSHDNIVNLLTPTIA